MIREKSVLPTANNPYNEIAIVSMSRLFPGNRTTRSGGVPYKSGSEKQTLR